MALPLRLLFTYIGVVVGASTQPTPNDTSPAPPSSRPLHATATRTDTPDSNGPHLLGFRFSENMTQSDGRGVIPPDKLQVTIYHVRLRNISAIEIVQGDCVGNGARTVIDSGIINNDDYQISFVHRFSLGEFEICVRHGDNRSLARFVQIADRTISVRERDVEPKQYKLEYLPIQISIVVLLHVLSAMFSGLTLGLMTLTVRELEIIAKSGSEDEQRYAKAILPLRKKGNQLLCTLLLGNTLCNATISILIDDMLTDKYSIPTATVTMLLFGEILPQSICVNNALKTGARLLFFAKFWIYLFGLVAWPISKVLDRIVGEEHEAYDRKRLMELMKRVIANNPDVIQDELKIAAGAMNLKGKSVMESMTPIEHVFMLPETATLNSSAIAKIVRAGYTRIPVFRAGNKKDICDVLIVKDLALIDPDDNYTVRMLCNIYKRPIPRMASSTTLFNALQTFKGGDDGHMAVVHDEKADAILGIITLEDVVEEILQDEIKDEFDLKREKRGHEKILWDTTAPPAVMGKQLMTVTYQFCVNNEEFFADRFIEKCIFQRLMAQCTKNVDMHYLKPLGGALTVPIKQLPRCARLYTKDEMSDRYILILEGRAEVTIGQGGMKFEAGPFHRFGQELLLKLMQHADALCKRNDPESKFDPKQLMQFKPDFSVAVFEDCTFLEVTADMYIKALRMTKLQKETKNTAAVFADFKSRGTPVMGLESLSPTQTPLMGSKESTPSKELSTANSLSSPNETETHSGRTGEGAAK